MNQSLPPKRKYYFWSYDSYPYLLGSPGVLRPSGLISAETFGGGTFRPIYEFGLTEGRKFKRALDQLEAERRKALADVKDLYERKLADLRSQRYVFAAASAAVVSSLSTAAIK